MTDTITHAAFTDKWRARWPEWRIGTGFVPAAQREGAMAWFALLQEFTDAAWTGEDATPGLAKLAWWNEELLGWAKGARRHPLADTLQRLPADWAGLAASLRSLQATREGGAGPDGAGPGLTPFASAVARIEARLFVDAAANAAQRLPAPQSVVIDLRAERALLHRDPAAAAHVLDSPSADRQHAVRPRRLQSAYLDARLRRMAGGGPVDAASPWRSLLLSWRAARERLAG